MSMRFTVTLLMNRILLKPTFLNPEASYYTKGPTKGHAGFCPSTALVNPGHQVRFGEFDG